MPQQRLYWVSSAFCKYESKLMLRHRGRWLEFYDLESSGFRSLSLLYPPTISCIISSFDRSRLGDESRFEDRGIRIEIFAVRWKSVSSGLIFSSDFMASKRKAECPLTTLKTNLMIETINHTYCTLEANCLAFQQATVGTRLTWTRGGRTRNTFLVVDCFKIHANKRRLCL